MNTREKIDAALKDAMRSHDEPRKRALRLALAAIKFSEIEKRAPLDEAGVLGVIQKEIKARHESIADAQKAGRLDLTAEAQADIAILEAFLPKPLSPEELEALARQAIQEAGATSLREMGAVMKLLLPRLEGRALGDQASQAVRRLLGSG
jgi:hypothetical protein